MVKRDQDVYIRGLHLLNGFRAFNRSQAGGIGRRQFRRKCSPAPMESRRLRTEEPVSEFARRSRRGRPCPHGRATKYGAVLDS